MQLCGSLPFEKIHGNAYMTLSTVPFGTEIVAEPRDSSESCAYRTDKLFSLQDLLNALQDQPPAEYPMLRSTAVKLSEFYARPADQIPLDLLPEDRETFRYHLKQHRYARNSVRSYTNYLNILISRAMDLGWAAEAPAAPAAWSSLLSTVTEAGCEKLLRHLAKQELSPATVQETDLYDWVQIEVKRGASYAKTRGRAALMRRIIVEAGFTSNLAVNKVRKNNYGIPLRMFPETLRAEVQDVLRWKQDRFVPSRPKNAQIRAVTARGIEGAFCRLYGFTVNVEGIQTITKLGELVTEQNVGRYISWCLNERHHKSEGLSICLGSICAALSHNPKYADITTPWMPNLLKCIPEDSGAEALQRKEEKYLPYSVLSGIPEMIRRERSGVPQSHHKAIALSVRDELVIQWLLVLPWRQRNIRECRIGGRNPNLIRAVLPKMTSVTRPDWLQMAEKQHGPVETWQFRFAPDETKTGNDVHCVLPQRLTPLLEEYLSVHRPRLVCGTDPGTLFLNEHGGALTQAMVRNVVSRLTLKYGGRVVTPHLFRDIFAYMWLELAPEDYLTLSKLLWHRNIQTSIRIYGQRFNESTALSRMERLLPA
jgi:integrase